MEENQIDADSLLLFVRRVLKLCFLTRSFVVQAAGEELTDPAQCKFDVRFKL